MGLGDLEVFKINNHKQSGSLLRLTTTKSLIQRQTQDEHSFLSQPRFSERDTERDNTQEKGI